MLPRLGRFLYRWRHVVGPAILGLILLSFPPPRETPPELRWIGFSALALGLLLRLLAAGMERIGEAPANLRLFPAPMYAHSRHPIYLGSLLVVAGLLMLHGNALGFFPGMMLFYGGYRALIAAEERMLLARFGGIYDRYCSEVPRWIPRPRGFRETLRSSIFRWRRVRERELGFLFAIWTATVLLLLWRRIRLEGWPAVEEQRTLYALLLASGAVVYVAARIPAAPSDRPAQPAE